MPLKGFLKIGSNYQLTVDSDPTTPGVSALAITWVPRPGESVPQPMVDAISPGARARHDGKIQPTQLLLLDFDLPSEPGAKISIVVEQDGSVVASGDETADGEWSFLVVS